MCNFSSSLLPFTNRSNGEPITIEHLKSIGLPSFNSNTNNNRTVAVAVAAATTTTNKPQPAINTTGTGQRSNIEENRRKSKEIEGNAEDRGNSPGV